MSRTSTPRRAAKLQRPHHPRLGDEDKLGAGRSRGGGRPDVDGVLHEERRSNDIRRARGDHQARKILSPGGGMGGPVQLRELPAGPVPVSRKGAGAPARPGPVTRCGCSRPLRRCRGPPEVLLADVQPSPPTHDTRHPPPRSPVVAESSVGTAKRNPRGQLNPATSTPPSGKRSSHASGRCLAPPLRITGSGPPPLSFAFQEHDL